MTKKMRLEIIRNTTNGTTTYEGLVTMEGATPFKLTKSRSKETTFNNQTNVINAGKTFASRCGHEMIIIQEEKTTKKKTIGAGSPLD